MVPCTPARGLGRGFHGQGRGERGSPSPAVMAGGQEGTSVWGGGERGGNQTLSLPISAWNGPGTCLPAASALISSISASAGVQAKGNNNPVSGCPEKNVSSTCVFVVKIPALKLSRGSGKVCACGIYRKMKTWKTICFLEIVLGGVFSSCQTTPLASSHAFHQIPSGHG